MNKIITIIFVIILIGCSSNQKEESKTTEAVALSQISSATESSSNQGAEEVVEDEVTDDNTTNANEMETPTDEEIVSTKLSLDLNSFSYHPGTYQEWQPLDSSRNSYFYLSINPIDGIGQNYDSLPDGSQFSIKIDFDDDKKIGCTGNIGVTVTCDKYDYFTVDSSIKFPDFKILPKQDDMYFEVIFNDVSSTVEKNYGYTYQIYYLDNGSMNDFSFSNGFGESVIYKNSIDNLSLNKDQTISFSTSEQFIANEYSMYIYIYDSLDLVNPIQKCSFKDYQPTIINCNNTNAFSTAINNKLPSFSLSAKNAGNYQIKFEFIYPDDYTGDTTIDYSYTIK